MQEIEVKQTEVEKISKFADTEGQVITDKVTKYPLSLQYSLGDLD